MRSYQFGFSRHTSHFPSLLVHAFHKQILEFVEVELGVWERCKIDREVFPKYFTSSDFMKMQYDIHIIQSPLSSARGKANMQNLARRPKFLGSYLKKVLMEHLTIKVIRLFECQTYNWVLCS